MATTKWYNVVLSDPDRFDPAKFATLLSRVREFDEVPNVILQLEVAQADAERLVEVVEEARATGMEVEVEDG